MEPSAPAEGRSPSLQRDGIVERIDLAIVTVAPALAPALPLLFLGWVCWDAIEGLWVYGPDCLKAFALLPLLPLGAQLFLWSASERRRMPHPLGIVLASSLLLVALLWPVGKHVASWIPSFCEISHSITVTPRRPGKLDPTATFVAGAQGWGNPRSYGFSVVTVIYTTRNRKDDLYVLLPRWEGFYISSCTRYFPVTREKVLEYVRSNDDFPKGEAEALAEELWSVLHDLAEHHNMPAFAYRGWDNPKPRIVYWVPGRNIYLVTACLCVPVLLVISGILMAWYCQCVPARPGSGQPSPGNTGG